MRYAIFLILIASINSTLGNIFLKYSRLHNKDSTSFEKFFSIPFSLAILFYIINLILFAKALDYIPVSVGYPVLASSSFLFLFLASNLLFFESINILKVTGILLIIAGIILISHNSVPE